MAKIVRTPTKASGGITPAEREQMRAHSDMWITRAMRTDPIDMDKIVPAIEGLYAAAGLKTPRVVIVPSPLVMAFAYGASAAIWHCRKTRAATRAATDAATYDATDAATYAATRAATDAATDDATDAATYAATRAATDDATRAATDAATRAATDAATDAATYAATYAATACLNLAGPLGLSCASYWWRSYQGGNMWAAYDCYLTAARDILGMRLPAHEAYRHWEQAAIHGGFRVMHPEFCIVSDFPDVLRVDAQNRPHSEDGPSHRWRDGWSLYHWHGVRVPDHWIADRDNLSAAEVMAESNLETRRAGIEILGWARIVDDLGGRVIEADPDPEIGSVIELNLPDLERPARFLRVRCATGRDFALGLPPDLKARNGYSLPHVAQAWAAGLDPAEWRKPSITA